MSRPPDQGFFYKHWIRVCVFTPVSSVVTEASCLSFRASCCLTTAMQGGYTSTHARAWGEAVTALFPCLSLRPCFSRCPLHHRDLRVSPAETVPAFLLKRYLPLLVEFSVHVPCPDRIHLHFTQTQRGMKWNSEDKRRLSVWLRIHKPVLTRLSPWGCLIPSVREILTRTQKKGSTADLRRGGSPFSFLSVCLPFRGQKVHSIPYPDFMNVDHSTWGQRTLSNEVKS